MKRIGVFVCHCGHNISATVDTDAVAAAAAALPGVVTVEQNKYTCSEPGQEMIRRAIREQGLDGVVVAACSPRMHELTFRRAAAKEDLNPYLVEIANIREQVSWVQPDKSHGTPVAIDAVRAAVAKLRRNEPLLSSRAGMEKRALVIGGGIAGIQAALDIAESGYPVTLVEREPSIGGKMAQLDKTFPTLDCSSCILTPRMVDVAQHPLITLYTYSEVEKVEGFVGNFTVKIRQKARKVAVDKCTGCGVCWEKCPAKVPSEFDRRLGPRKAIYVPFPQAVPLKPVIDEEHCIYYQNGKCRACEKLCPSGAIAFDQPDEMLTERVGAIVVATGYDLWDPSGYVEYGYGRYPDVIDSLQFERLLSSTGPTGGVLKRPSDGGSPETVAFIQCVGSRDEAKGVPYCSKACCMYTAKHAILLKERVPEAESFVFYMDIRTPGKGYEEFQRRAALEHGAQYVRGRVSRIFPRGGKLVVKGEDTLLGRPVEVEADLVVLAPAMVPRSDAPKVAQTLGFSYDQYGFFTEAHPKLAPVETNTGGIFLAGAAIGPKDIPETVAQGSAAAAKVLRLLSKDHLLTEPTVAVSDPAKCSGCRWCVAVCSYRAIEMIQIPARYGPDRQVARVNASLCHGCGSCTVACRDGAMDLLGFRNEQLVAEVDALCRWP